MEYTPKTWECGEIITAEDLNHIEQGLANAGGVSAPLLVNIAVQGTEEDPVLVMDKTFQEIADAFPNVYCVASEQVEGGQSIATLSVGWINTEEYDDDSESDNLYQIILNSDYPEFRAQTPSDYPSTISIGGTE